MIFGVASNASAYIDNNFIVKERPIQKPEIKIDNLKVNEINLVSKQLEAQKNNKVPEGTTLGSKIDIFV